MVGDVLGRGGGVIAWYTSASLSCSAAVYTSSTTTKTVVTGREGRGRSTSQRPDGSRRGERSPAERSWARSLPGGSGVGGGGFRLRLGLTPRTPRTPTYLVYESMFCLIEILAFFQVFSFFMPSITTLSP